MKYSYHISRIICLLLLIISCLLLVNRPVSAQNLLPSYNDVPGFGNFAFANATIGDIFTAALKYIYIFAGLGVFLYLIFGGFQLLTSGGDPAGVSAGAGKIVNAIIGFVIIFSSYWLVQIIEVIFGMTIL